MDEVVVERAFLCGLVRALVRSPSPADDAGRVGGGEPEKEAYTADEDDADEEDEQDDAEKDAAEVVEEGDGIGASGNGAPGPGQQGPGEARARRRRRLAALKRLWDLSVNHSTCALLGELGAVDAVEALLADARSSARVQEVCLGLLANLAGDPRVASRAARQPVLVRRLAEVGVPPILPRLHARARCTLAPQAVTCVSSTCTYALSSSS